MAEHNKTHPMHSLTEQIDERGLMVFDDIRRMPVYHEPYTTPYMTIGLNLEGWVRAECDMQPVCFRRHDIAVLTPHHILCAHESSPDYHAMLIVMSVRFQEEMKRHYTNVYRDNFFYLYQHDLSLTDKQFACVLHLFQMLRTVSLTESDNRWQMLGDLLDVLFLLLQDYRRQNGIDARKHTPTKCSSPVSTAPSPSTFSRAARCVSMPTCSTSRPSTSPPSSSNTPISTPSTGLTATSPFRPRYCCAITAN